tara:strand:+ start:254 stop:556 length:303 start_codon:yes stop_codon:yes gene_type:complete
MIFMSKMSTESVKAQNETIQMTDGEGNEIIGLVRVIKVVNPNADDGGRPFHLEFDMSDELWNQIVFYGSEILNSVDLLNAGIRGAILETIDTRQKNSKKV